jgi:ubiquinone/menaquinone biosynthesis C-methylase UbiE
MSEKLEQAVVSHYARWGLEERLFAAIGPGPYRLEDLAPVDEFHTAGRAATEMLIAKLGIRRGSQVLDVGSGIGGPARTVASITGARVMGIDLTPEFVAIARKLSERTGLSDSVTFETASALGMPFADDTFDAAITLHVAMNIADRAGLYREVARVCKPGALFGIYDVMRGSDAGFAFPVPWAEAPEASHLLSADETRAAVEAAGFRVESTDDLSAFGSDFLAKRLAPGVAQPALSLSLLIGDSARTKLINVLDAYRSGALAPVMIIARKAG